MSAGSILIVDDDQSVQELFGLALGDVFEIRRAATAAEALRIARDDRVALMLLDYRLPDATGLELLADLRAAGSRLPVIMVTGYGSEWVCTAAFRLGIADYLPKPVDMFELSHAVRRALAAEVAGRADGNESGDTPPRSTDPVPRSPDLPIQKAVELIRRRYWDNLSLDQLAREIGMSRYRLSHRFTEVMGVPLRTYLLRVRLERAKDLLSAGHASITEVAQAVGFGDLPRFDKLFRRDTGLTPSAYRTRALPATTKTNNPATNY